MQSLNPHHTSLTDEPDDPVELMAQNLLRIKEQVSLGDNRQEQETGRKTQRVVEEYEPHQNDIIMKEYQDFTDELPSNFQSMSYEMKIKFLLQENSTGSLMYLFELVYYFREALPPETLYQIAEQAAVGLSSTDQVHLRCSLQLLALVGIVDEQMLQRVSRMMLQEQIPFDLGFLYLCNTGYPGLFTLIDIANKDFQQLPLTIMDHLSRCQSIIQEILIPVLYNDIVSSTVEHKRRLTALAVLNRLNRINNDVKVTSTLAKMLIDGSLDRGLLASTVRASGDTGQDYLLKLLSSASNNKIKLPIISVLPWRVPEEPDLQISVVEYAMTAGFPPGVMYQYHGSLEPSAYISVEDETAKDQLILNSRDFMAALHRVLNSKFTTGQHEQQMRSCPVNSKDLFLLVQLVKSKQEQQNVENGYDSSITISSEVVRTLMSCLSNPIVEIREASLNALGVIGLPDAQESIDKVVKCLTDVDSKNRSMACWTISKLCDTQEPNSKIIKKMVELLRDSYWKVRTSACIALGAVIRSPNELVIEALVRCLKDGSINKNTICQTMIHMGSIGEEILIEILKNTHSSDVKLKTAIIGCFKFADITKPSIDFVIEQLFRHASDENVQIRALCLETLNHLRQKAKGENITYLKAKNILPLFYFFLEDSSQKLRQIAVQAILSFGSQAQLIFIQGLTKSQNIHVRIESAKALCRMGVQNFRAIIFGLRDQDDRVRKATSQAILHYFTKDDIMEEFNKKSGQIASLVCHLKDIALSYSIPTNMKQLLEQLIYSLQDGPKRQRTNYLNKQNEDMNRQPRHRVSHE